MVDTGVDRSVDGRSATQRTARIDVSDLDLPGVLGLRSFLDSARGRASLRGIDLPGALDSPSDQESSASRDADRVCGAVTGPDLAALLDAADPASMATDYEVLEAVAAWDKLAAWVAAQQARALAEFARRPESVSADPAVALAGRRPIGTRAREFAADEVAARLRTSVKAAERRIDLATALSGRHRATGAMLEAGRLDEVKARAVVEGCLGIDDDTARAVELRVLDRAPTLAPARLRESVRRAILVADPAGAEQRYTRARCERRVVVTPVADGMAELWALLPAADAMRVKCVLSAVARAARGDGRTADQRMADALVAPFAEALVDGELRANLVDSGPRLRLARRRGEPVRLDVTVPASTLLGISREPGELAGYGPITADTARELAGDATWRRLLTDPLSGEVLDVGTARYRPSAALRRHVELRDRLCRHPSCGWPAQATDLDHTVPFPAGATSAANLGAFCRRHHRFKQAGGVFRVRQVEPGRFVWTMPTGHRYTVLPPPAAPSVGEEYRPPADDYRPPDLT